jgi:tetratricopeptide (TPR) repeat protein
VSKSNLATSSILRLGVTIAIIVACVVLMKDAASFGLSKILGRFAISTNSIAAANEAVALTPADPEARQARSILLSRIGRTAEALREMEIAVSLRPKDDYLWLELGNLRDSNGDQHSALAAFDNAVRFAPHYGHTHWQRGNLLIRLGRYEEGFNDLRLAASRNRDFLPSLIDLAWSLSRGDATATERLVGFDDAETRLALARFYANHGKGVAALEQLRKVRTIPEPVRADLIRSLIQTKSYLEAFEIWRSATPDSVSAFAIQNSDFEQDLSFDHVGFGWQISRHDQLKVALDVNNPHKGSRSLRITFEGYDNPAVVLSQLMLVQPQHTYEVQAWVRTKDLITGGPPVLGIVDAADGAKLGASDNLGMAANSDWTNVSFEFKSPQTSRAVYLRLERQACSSSPCPIFGHVWLDAFELQELPQK